MIRIQKKMALRKVLHDGNFDHIAFWRDGSWANVGSGYGGEQDGNNPVAIISRPYFYDVSHKDITEKFVGIEDYLNSSFIKEISSSFLRDVSSSFLRELE